MTFDFEQALRDLECTRYTWAYPVYWLMSLLIGEKPVSYIEYMDRMGYRFTHETFFAYHFMKKEMSK